MADTTEKEWLDVKTIQEKYLPISRKAIRKFLKEISPYTSKLL